MLMFVVAIRVLGENGQLTFPIVLYTPVSNKLFDSGMDDKCTGCQHVTALGYQSFWIHDSKLQRLSFVAFPFMQVSKSMRGGRKPITAT